MRNGARWVEEQCIWRKQHQHTQMPIQLTNIACDTRAGSPTGGNRHTRSAHTQTETAADAC